MTTHLEHAGLGVSIDLPEIRQRDAEALLETYRLVRRRREAGRQEVIAQTADDIMAAILSAQLGKLKPGSEALAELCNRAAEGIAQRMSNTPLDDITNQEDAGNWARAAVRLGWMGEMAEDEIGDLSLGATLWIAKQVLDAITEAKTVPNG